MKIELWKLEDYLRKMGDSVILKLIDDDDNDEFYKGTSSVALDNLPAEMLEYKVANDRVVYDIEEDQYIIEVKVICK